MFEVRAETPADRAAIRKVNEAAFGRPDEASLVDALRDAGALLVSLVAEEDGVIAGHVLFSSVSVEPKLVEAPELAAPRGKFFGLAPLAVLPAHQGRDLGSRLVRAGVEVCGRLGCDAVFVLGDPAYYRCFGFVTAATRGLRCEYPVPDEAFMVVELRPDALNGLRGMVRYRREFRAL